MASGNQVKRQGESKPDLKSITIATSSYQGALPPPEMLERFDRIVPGGAERIFAMAEAEMKHRHQYESNALQLWAKETSRGQVFAFFIVLCSLSAAVFAGIKGAQMVGAFIGAGGVVGLAGVFIAGRRRRHD